MIDIRIVTGRSHQFESVLLHRLIDVDFCIAACSLFLSRIILGVFVRLPFSQCENCRGQPISKSNETLYLPKPADLESPSHGARRLLLAIFTRGYHLSRSPNATATRSP